MSTCFQPQVISFFIVSHSLIFKVFNVYYSLKLQTAGVVSLLENNVHRLYNVHHLYTVYDCEQ